MVHQVFNIPITSFGLSSKKILVSKYTPTKCICTNKDLFGRQGIMGWGEQYVHGVLCSLSKKANLCGFRSFFGCFFHKKFAIPEWKRPGGDNYLNMDLETNYYISNFFMHMHGNGIMYCDFVRVLGVEISCYQIFNTTNVGEKCIFHTVLKFYEGKFMGMIVFNNYLCNIPSVIK